MLHVRSHIVQKWVLQNSSKMQYSVTVIYLKKNQNMPSVYVVTRNVEDVNERKVPLESDNYSLSFLYLSTFFCLLYCGRCWSHDIQEGPMLPRNVPSVFTDIWRRLSEVNFVLFTFNLFRYCSLEVWLDNKNSTIEVQTLLTHQPNF
jgi:hypothetical protein